MFKIILDVLLSILFILSILFLITWNIVRFIWWLKSLKKNENLSSQYFSQTFWPNEWGQECTEAEIKELYKILEDFQNKAN